MEDDGEDSGSETQENENFTADEDTRDNILEKERSNDFEDEEFASFMAGMSGNNAKRLKRSTKVLECLDMDGNIISLYKSGISVVRALGIPQADILQCCRGYKDSVNGLKFRFVEEDESRMNFRVGEDERQMTRFTRNRNEADRYQESKPSILAPRELHVRKWQRVNVKYGGMILPRWVSTGAASAALQEFQRTKKSGKKRRRGKSGQD